MGSYVIPANPIIVILVRVKGKRVGKVLVNVINKINVHTSNVILVMIVTEPLRAINK